LDALRFFLTLELEFHLQLRAAKLSNVKSKLLYGHLKSEQNNLFFHEGSKDILNLFPLHLAK